MNCFDIYRFLSAAINSYMDSILIKEDPTDNEKKQYEELKYWLSAAEPNDKVVDILKSLEINTKREEEESNE